MGLTVGLTGGIGSGKSAVANFFREFAIDIIDADEVAKELLDAHTGLIQRIIRQFGPSIQDPDTKTIDRRKLREHIFSDDTARIWLDNLMHPEIRAVMGTRAIHSKTPYCILVIPLLVENQAYQHIDRILVVDTDEVNQIQRTISRDTCSADDVRAIVDSQASRQERLAVAHDVIENNRDLAHLEQAVDKLHEYYLQLAVKYS